MTQQTNGNHTNGTVPSAHGAAGKKNGNLYRDYVDDRNAKSEEVIYTTSNGVPYPVSLYLLM